MKDFFKQLRARLGKQNGFTVVETILSTSIMALGFMGGMAVMQNSVAGTVKGDRSTMAIQIAQEKVEEILADNQFRGYDFASDSTNYDSESLDGGYVRSVSLTEVDPNDFSVASPGSGLSNVTVTVIWGNAYGQTVSYSTLIAE